MEHEHGDVKVEQEVDSVEVKGNNSQKNKAQTYVGVLLLGVVVLGIGWYVYSQFISSKDTTIKDGGISVGLTEGEGDIQQIPVDTTLPTPTKLRSPDVSQPLIFPQGFDATAKGIIQNNVTQLREQIQADETSFQPWADLATQYFIISDYSKAQEIWEYLNLTATTNVLSRINLGNLYHFQLKEFEKSEKNFNEAISINPSTVEAYLGLHELYKYSYKTNTNLAETSLTDGIKRLPNNLSLLMTLASYYKERGLNTQARDTYTKAKVEAEKQGNTSLVESINAELQAL